MGVNTVAGELRGAVTSRQVRLTVPGGTNAAWSVGSVATAVTSDWQPYLGLLAGRVEAFGGDLVTAGTEYRATDDAAARRMREPHHQPGARLRLRDAGAGGDRVRRAGPGRRRPR